jgi:hypothetical protein
MSVTNRSGRRLMAGITLLIAVSVPLATAGSASAANPPHAPVAPVHAADPYLSSDSYALSNWNGFLFALHSVDLPSARYWWGKLPQEARNTASSCWSMSDDQCRSLGFYAGLRIRSGQAWPSDVWLVRSAAAVSFSTRNWMLVSH